MPKSQKNTCQKKIICPECDTPIKVSGTLSIGIILECPSCLIESECISINPLKLAPLEEEK